MKAKKPNVNVLDMYKYTDGLYYNIKTEEFCKEVSNLVKESVSEQELGEFQFIDSVTIFYNSDSLANEIFKSDINKNIVREGTFKKVYFQATNLTPTRFLLIEPRLLDTRILEYIGGK